MTLNFETEINEITGKPKPAVGCLDCEKILAEHSRKLLRTDI